MITDPVDDPPASRPLTEDRPSPRTLGGPHGFEGPYTSATANVGVNRLVTSLRTAGTRPNQNVYAELGSTWRSVMGDPDQAGHVLGKLLVAVGEDNVLWGTDSIWYGSPQDQIQAFRAFEITAEAQERDGYPSLTPAVKRKVLGENAARVYGFDLPQLDAYAAEIGPTVDEIATPLESIPAGATSPAFFR